MQSTVNLTTPQKVYRGLSPLLSRWLFPARCTLCDATGHDDLDICNGCLTDLPRNQRACLRCALPIKTQTASVYCGHCLSPKTKQHYDTAWAAYIYKSTLPWLITQLKFHEHLNHARLLSELMWRQLQGPLAHLPVAKPDVIMPIPLHAKRLRERGFNQALEIAAPLSRLSGIPLDTRSLKRIRPTDRQSTLTQNERARNLLKAFACEDSLKGLHIALVDDVMTSGNTVNAAAKTLKRAGAERVSVWVVARAELNAS